MSRADEVNIGLVGTGFMGKGHCMAYLMAPRIFDELALRPRLAVVGDVSLELARGLAREYGFARAVEGWHDVVASPDVDVVDITAPNHLHHEIALAAARAGKHIYCEKPLSLDARQALDMVTAAEEAGVTTLVGFNYLKNPAVLVARQMIEEGELGEIYHFRGEFHQDVLVDPLQPFSWRFERRQAGSGALGDLGAHVVAMAHFLVGDIRRVSALMRTFIAERPQAAGAYGYGPSTYGKGPMRQVENEDSAHLLVDFAGGATGTIESSRVAAGRKVFLTFEVNGSKGSLHFVHERMNELEVYLSGDPAGQRGFKTVLLGPDHPFYRKFWPVAGCGLGFADLKTIEVHELLESLSQGRAAQPDFRDGYRVSRVIEAAELAARQGRWVEVDEI